MLCHYKCHYIDISTTDCHYAEQIQISLDGILRSNVNQHSSFGNTAQADSPKAARLTAAFYNHSSPTGRSNAMNNNAKIGMLGLYGITLLSLLVNIPGGSALHRHVWLS